MNDSIGYRTFQILLLLGSAPGAWAAPGGVPAEIESLKAAVASIQTQATASMGQVTALQGQVSTLTSANTALTSSVVTLRSSVSALQTTNGTLMSQIAALQAADSTIGVAAVSRGSVLFNGSVVSGSDFFVLADLPVGRYVVVYTKPKFTATPSCVVSAQQGQQPAVGANFYCKLDNADISGLVVQCYAPPGLSFINNYASSVNNATSPGNFQFICAQ